MKLKFGFIDFIAPCHRLLSKVAEAVCLSSALSAAESLDGLEDVTEVQFKFTMICEQVN